MELEQMIQLLEGQIKETNDHLILMTKMDSKSRYATGFAHGQGMIKGVELALELIKKAKEQDYAEYLEEEMNSDDGLWEAEEAWLKHAEDRGLEDA